MRRGTLRQRALWLALLLALPAAVASSHATPEWDEVAGGPGRTGAAFLPSATLDVLASGDLFEESYLDLVRARGLVATPHGLKAVTDDCQLLTIDLDTFATTSMPLDQCAGGRLVAYDRARDHLIVCRRLGTSTDPTLQARDARTGEIVWTIVPGEHRRRRARPARLGMPSRCRCGRQRLHCPLRRQGGK